MVKGGAEFGVSTWDILTGKVSPGENVLLYDSQSQHQGPSTAEFLAKRGSLVEIVTYDRVVAGGDGRHQLSRSTTASSTRPARS